MSPLISVPELAADASRPLLIDLRPAHEFARGQIPGAVHLDLWGVSLIDTSAAPLAAFTWMIAHLFELRGVTDARAVVVYEGDSGMRAARAWWLLEYLGHPHPRLLDGGYQAWVTAGHPVSTEPEAPVPSQWSGAVNRATLATWQDVRDRLDDAGTALVDARSAAEYRGELVRARRGGHIPGAVNVEWKDNLEPDGRFKPAAALAAMYDGAGLTPDREIVTYCQGGYRAAHAMLALRLAGYQRVRNYTGSWKEWGDRQDLPVAGV
jgi:thiosulfate/3-mercaptopyruvate sulfurtransferase